MSRKCLYVFRANAPGGTLEDHDEDAVSSGIELSGSLSIPMFKSIIIIPDILFAANT